MFVDTAIRLWRFRPAGVVLGLSLVMGMVAPARATDEDQELLELLAVLDEQTELATQTRMNADFVPGMVTVLHGEELDERGIQTVAEALDTVPGLRVTFTNDGNIVTLVRGAGSTLNSGNLKILLNGISMNSAATGLADAVLRIPIEQVDRIEVVRGPGSAIHGEFAFGGVLNLITRSRDDGAYAEVGSHQGRHVGAMLNGGDAVGGVTWFANFSAWDSDGSERNSGPDRFARLDLGHSPGRIDDYERGRLLLLGGDLAGFSLSGQWLRLERGGWFGINALAPPEGLSPRNESLLNFSLERRWELNERVTAELLLNSLNNDLETAEHLPVPAGVPLPMGGETLPVDQYRQHSVDDSRREVQARMHWQAHADHRLLLGLGYVHSQIDDAGTRIRDDRGLIRELSGAERSVVPGVSRRVGSVTLQDQWRIREDLELTAGLRYDHYSDAGDNLSPRVAAVWRPADRHVFKAQYAEAFRPPTLVEDSSGGGFSSLLPETLSSTELAYIHRAPNRIHRLIFFHTELRDVIEFELIPGQVPRTINRGRIRLRGFEAEYQQRLGLDWEVLADVSFVDAKDESSRRQLPGSSRWLANLTLVWRPDTQLSNALRVGFVGEQRRFSLEPSVPEYIDDYVRVNYALTVRNAFEQRGLNLSAGVENLFDSDARTLANPTFYPEELPLDGRTWWAKVAVRY